MRKLTFSLLLVAATFIVKSSNAQTRGNASDWRIPPPYIPSGPTATLPQVKLPLVKQPDNPGSPGDMEPDEPAMPALPKWKLPYVLPPIKSPAMPMPEWVLPVNPLEALLPYVLGPAPRPGLPLPGQPAVPGTPQDPKKPNVTAPPEVKSIPGAPTTPGYWSSEKLGGGEAYWWHPGVPGNPKADGPGYYDHDGGGGISTFTGASVGPSYWHMPFETPPLGIPGLGHFTPTEPPGGGMRYYLHPGTPRDPYERGPGYYDTLGGSDLSEILGFFVGPYYWIPDVPPQPVRPPVQPTPPGQLFNYTPDIIIATSVLLF